MPLRTRSARRPGRRVRRALRKPARKRNARLRRRFAKSSQGLRTLAGGFPKSMMIKMKWRQIQTNISSTVTPSVTQFRGNSIYDPAVALGGAQPKYFATLSRVYNQYRVHACKIRVTPFYPGLGSEQPLLAIIPSGFGTPTYVTWNQILEDSHVKWMTVVTNSAVRHQTLTHWAKSKNILNLKDLKDNSDAAGPINNNPSHEWYFTIYQGHPNNATPVTMYAHIELTYYVEWFDLNESAGQ